MQIFTMYSSLPLKNIWECQYWSGKPGSIREHCGALGLKFIDPIFSATDENSEGQHCLPKVTFANGVFWGTSILCKFY